MDVINICHKSGIFHIKHNQHLSPLLFYYTSLITSITLFYPILNIFYPVLNILFGIKNRTVERRFYFYIILILGVLEK